MTTAPGDGSNGCTSAFTRILWTIGTIEPGQSLDLVYTATMQAQPPAGATFTNTATLTGSSISGTHCG